MGKLKYLYFSIYLVLSLTSTSFSYDKTANSISDVSSNVNSLDTRKWGSLYVSFPQISGGNLYCCLFAEHSKLYPRGHYKLYRWFFSFVFEYKKYISKKIALGVKFNINNTKVLSFEKKKMKIQKNDNKKELIQINEQGVQKNNEEEKKNEEEDEEIDLFCHSNSSIIFCLNWVYFKKGNNVYSGSFSPIGFHFLKINNWKKKSPTIYSFGFTLSKYENIKTGFYMNAFNFLLPWSVFNLYYKKHFKFCIPLLLNLCSFEFGFNICRVIK